jgi:hypothetical protein
MNVFRLQLLDLERVFQVAHAGDQILHGAHQVIVAIRAHTQLSSTIVFL